METNKEQSKDSAEALEHALWESKDRCRQLVELTPDTIAVHSEGKIIFINNAGANLLGAANPEQLIGKQIMDFLHPEYRDIVKERTQQIAEEGKEVPLIEEKFIRLDGTIIDVEVTAIPFTHQGKPAVQAVVHDITKRKLAEEALRQNEERFRTLVENIPGEVYRCLPTPPYRLIHNSAEIESITGYPVSNFLAGPLFYSDFILPEDLEMVNSALEAGIACKEPFNIEYRLRHADGSIRWVSERGRAVYSEQGEPLWLDGVIFDITERKQVEAALQQNERKLRLITENLRDTVFAYDMNRQLIFVNSTFEILTGYTIGELYARNFINYLHPDDAPRIISLWEDLFQGKAFAGEEFRIVRKDGQIRWCASSWSPLLDEQGQQIGIQGRGTDITEHKRAEEEIKVSETRYRELFNSINNGVAVYEARNDGEEFIITDFNHAAERIENVSKEDLIGKSVTEVFPGVREFGLFDIFQRVLRTGKSEHHPISFYQDARLAGWRENYVYKLPTGEIVAVYEDITERKQAEEALRESEEKYRTLVENIPGSEFRCEATPPHRVIHQSTEIENICGYPASDFLDGSVLFDDIELPEDVEKINQAIESAIADKKSYVIEYRLRHADGSIHWVSERGHVIYSEQGEPLWLNGISFDITEQKQIEKALQESEERFRTLFEQAAVGVALLETKTGRYVSINQRYCDFLGYTKEEMLGRSFQDVTYPEDIQKNVDNNALLNKGKIKEFSIEKRYVCKDGTLVWGRLTASPLWKSGEKPDNYFHIAVVEDITERKRAEDALRESEMKMKMLIELLPVGVSILNAENKLIYANPILERILGISREGLMRGNYRGRRYLRPDGSLMSAEEYASQRAIKEQKVISGVEIGVEKEDGNIVWTSVSAVPVSLSDWRVIMVTVDITERKRVEEALQKSEARFSTVFHASPLSIAFTRLKDNTLIDVNEAWQKMTGYNREEAIDRTTIELNGWVNPVERKRLFRMLYEQGTVHSFEFQMRQKSGNLKDVLISAAQIEVAGEQCILGMALDITERNRTEKALQESEERFRSFSKATFEAFSIHEAGVLLSANDQFFEMFGYKPDELLGKQVIPLVIAPKARKYMREQIAKGGRAHYESAGLRKDGKEFPIEIRVQEMEYEGRKVRVGVMMDITERKETESEREALLQQVRASHAELRTLAAYLQTALEDERTSISREIHDEFGQRLTALKMDMAWLSTRIPPAESQVQEKMVGMTSMLQDLIQYTRQVASNLRPGLLDDLGLNAAIEWYAKDWGARHRKDIYIHLPDRELPLNRKMSTALYRILQETLTNVARHAEATRVDVYLEMADDHVVLKVRDNGRGISQKEIRSSTALGLLGMRERAYQFSGELEISGKPGRGTTVQVRLPLKQGT